MIVLIVCPWDQTNQQHKIEIDPVDSDGHPVSFSQGTFGQPEPAVHLKPEFEVGRPPGVPRGNSLPQLLSFYIGPGLPLTPGQNHQFRMTIDGEHTDSWLATF